MAANTIGEVLAWGIAVHGYCPGCGASRVLDLHALAVANGEDLPLDRLKRRLRCSRCRSRVDIMVSGQAVGAQPIATHTREPEEPPCED